MDAHECKPSTRTNARPLESIWSQVASSVAFMYCRAPCGVEDDQMGVRCGLSHVLGDASLWAGWIDNGVVLELEG